jgi:hypothetical protein
LLARAAVENTSPGILTSAALTSACGPDMVGYLGYTTLVTGLPAGLGLAVRRRNVLLMSAIVDLALPVATVASRAQLARAKALMPTMATPIPFVLIALITAGSMITRSRRATRSD